LKKPDVGFKGFITDSKETTQDEESHKKQKTDNKYKTVLSDDTLAIAMNKKVRRTLALTSHFLLRLMTILG